MCELTGLLFISGHGLVGNPGGRLTGACDTQVSSTSRRIVKFCCDFGFWGESVDWENFHGHG